MVRSRPMRSLSVTPCVVPAVVLAVVLAACGGAARPDGTTGLLAAGSAAPDLSAPDQSGNVRRIADERGHPLVVYFYPRDGTPGCTKEACAFRDQWDRYQKA